jgi:hypothetical protein
VKNKLIKDALQIYWKLNEWFVYWVNFYSSFIAINHTHMKYCESKEEIKEEKELGNKQKEQRRKLK